MSGGEGGCHLIGCSVSVQRDTQLIVALVLAGQSDAGAEWHLDTGDRVTQVTINFSSRNLFETNENVVFQPMSY